MAGLGLHFDEAQYWVWSTHLDWGYFSKPPMIAALYHVASTLLGDEPWVFRATAGMLYMAAAIVAGRTAQEAFGPNAGPPTTVALASIPGLAISAGFLTTDAPLVLFWSVALLLLQRASARSSQTGHWIGLGLVVGLGLLSKYTMGAFALSAFGWLLTRPQGRALLKQPGPWLALLIAGFVCAPNLLWNAQHGFPTLRHTQEISQLDRAGVRPDRLIEFLLSQVVVAGPALLLCGLLALRRRLLGRVGTAQSGLIDPYREGRGFFLWMSLPLLLLACVQATLSRAQVNWALPAYLGLTVLLVLELQTLNWQRCRRYAVVLNLIVLAIFLHWPLLRQPLGLNAGARGDLFARFYGWREFAGRLQGHLDGQTILVNDDRASLALLAYGLRLPLARIAAWNPRGDCSSHWHCFVNLVKEPSGSETPQRYLIVSANIDDAQLREHFQSITRLPDDVGPNCAACQRPWRVWLAAGFRGYRSDASSSERTPP